MATKKTPKQPRSKKGATEVALAPQVLERRIYVIRGQRVMLDSDIAETYEVSTKRLNEQVNRNKTRFPKDFMFRLTKAEAENLRSQFATSSWGGRRTMPLAFTEHGVSMLSSVLKSERAIQMNILIVRAFVTLREVIATHTELASRVERVENIQEHHDSLIDLLAREIEQMKRLPPAPRRRIGFHATV